jgi:hypothetical protein
MSRIDRLVAEHCVTFRIIWHRAVNIIWHTTFWCLATPQPMLLIQAATGERRAPADAVVVLLHI